jgi:hypothetical protein
VDDSAEKFQARVAPRNMRKVINAHGEFVNGTKGSLLFLKWSTAHTFAANRAHLPPIAVCFL